MPPTYVTMNNEYRPFYNLAPFVESASEFADDPAFSKMALSRCMQTIGSIVSTDTTNNRPVKRFSSVSYATSVNIYKERPVT